MSITPGIPEDWADTNPESTTPERILPTPEGVTPSATKVAMVCYAVGAASKCWEHPERAGVFDSDRASQIVTELCVALGVEQQGDAAPESARPATLTPEQAENAPAQGEDSQSPSGPVLPRRIEPEDVRVGMVVERRKGEAAHRDRVQQIDGDLIVGTDGAWLWVPANADGGWSLWLIEDAPAPVDPDAAVIEVMARVTHDQNCCKEWDDHGNGVREVWREAARDALDTLWEEGYRIEANTMSQDAPAPVDPDSDADGCWKRVG